MGFDAAAGGPTEGVPMELILAVLVAGPLGYFLAERSRARHASLAVAP